MFSSICVSMTGGSIISAHLRDRQQFEDIVKHMGIRCDSAWFPVRKYEALSLSISSIISTVSVRFLLTVPAPYLLSIQRSLSADPLASSISAFSPTAHLLSTSKE